MVSRFYALTAPDMIRPADTAVYAAGDLVANSTTAASVVPFIFGSGSNVPFMGGVLTKCRIFKSTTNSVQATFRLHIYAAAPDPQNGDNGAWLTSAVAWFTAFDVTINHTFSNGSAGVGTPMAEHGSDVPFRISGKFLYGLLEVRGNYNPGSAESFRVSLGLNQEAA